MGLDNGIVIRKKDNQKIELPSFVKDVWGDIDSDNAVELAYWRKCWGTRDRIIALLGGTNDTGSYPLNGQNVLAILDILKRFLHKDFYEKYEDSIWEYDEQIETAVQRIVNLSWLSSYMLDNDDIEVYFYDSY